MNGNKNISQKICVILHLYYQEMWKEFKYYLTNLSQIQNFDLYITVTRNDKDLFEKINSAFNKNIRINIDVIENEPKGADIYPFIYILNKINLDNYDIVYKLHTKQNIDNKYFRLGLKIRNIIFLGRNLWRNFLVNEILGKKNANKCIDVFKKDKKVGMVCFRPLLINVTETDRKIFAAPSYLYKKYKDKNIVLSRLKNYSFCAGTIFAIRADILKILQNKYKRENFSDYNSGAKFSEEAWSFENLFGYIVKDQGYKILGTNLFSNKIILTLISFKPLCKIFKFYVNKFIFGRNIL